MSRPDPAAGVLETVCVEGGRALLLGEHLARLRASVRALFGAVVGEELDALVAEALDGFEADCRLRVIWAPGRGVRARLAPLGVGAEPVLLRPWALPGGLGAHKWADRRPLDAATERLGATPLVLDADGAVLEAAWGNVWALEGRRLVTPPADGRLLPGVTRARLLLIAPQLGFEAAEEALDVARLSAADAIVVTSAVRMAVAARLGAEPVDPHPAVAIAGALHDDAAR